MPWHVPLICIPSGCVLMHTLIVPMLDPRNYLLGGSGGMPPRKILDFTHSEIVSRAILQELDDML